MKCLVYVVHILFLHSFCKIVDGFDFDFYESSMLINNTYSVFPQQSLAYFTDYVEKFGSDISCKCV